MAWRSPMNSIIVSGSDERRSPATSLGFSVRAHSSFSTVQSATCHGMTHVSGLPRKVYGRVRPQVGEWEQT
jgi:hypothetical protein